MITKMELITLLADMESARIERTISVNNTDKFSQAVCAFANDIPNTGKPGYLVVGADDKTGKPVGMNVTDQLLLNLGGLRSDGNILPLPVIAVEKFSLDGGEVAVVEVLPSDMPPVRYKGQVWVRIGPRKAIASEQEERILAERRKSNNPSWDSIPVIGAMFSTFSKMMFVEYRKLVVAEDIITSNNRTLEEQFASLRFFDLLMNSPTAAGILVFDEHPRYYFPCAYVQFLRMSRDSLTDLPNDQAEISGNLPTIVREIDARIKANITTGMVQNVETWKDTLFPDYPFIAVREILLNALLHRDYQFNAPVRFYWYADRVEIDNPGGLYGDVTQDTLTTRAAYRNPILSEAMKAYGFINRFGYGIQRAQAEMRRNGNPPIEFTADQSRFHAVLRKKIQENT